VFDLSILCRTGDTVKQIDDFLDESSDKSDFRVIDQLVVNYYR
jgi:hypothetical protein